MFFVLNPTFWGGFRPAVELLLDAGDLEYMQRAFLRLVKLSRVPREVCFRGNFLKFPIEKVDVLGQSALLQLFDQSKPPLCRLADLPLLFGRLFSLFQFLPQPMFLLPRPALEWSERRQFMRVWIRLRQKFHLVGQDILFMLVDFSLRPDHLLGAHAQAFGFEMRLFFVPVHHPCQAKTERTHRALELPGNLHQAAIALLERATAARILPEEIRDVAARTDSGVQYGVGAVDIGSELDQVTRFLIRRK